MNHLAVLITGWLLTLTVSAASLKFSTFPSNDPGKIVRALTPFVEHLTRESGFDIELVIARDYDELFERLQEGTVDIAWLNSLSYAKLRHTDSPPRYLATYTERNARGEITPYYHAYIVTLANSGIDEADDMVDTVFGFVDRGSTSGYAYPYMMLVERGIEPEEFFRDIFFMKKHDRVLEALVAGSLDAGAMSDGTYFNGIDKYGERFRILLQSDPIPLDALVADRTIDTDIIAELRRIIVEISSDSPVTRAVADHLGWPAAGFRVLDESFYDSLNEALRYLND
ncbi:MAG: phosphate/phosphite/phosphonate ABC transporter substrate-binding protein [Candidatus Competibacterales bacterium]|nr:phosphate/phosphite/phosphonate ABC transporter substrate-binding protein [Candidatus Competibacterales bacterium]